jgi:UDP-MurNAc hydroxylase
VGRITFVSHASVIIDVDGVRILCDPWQDGTAFNNSWSLLVPAHALEAELATVNYIWVSHEHPDHFHFPTLRALPADFRARTKVLFQANHSDKMAVAFKKTLGFADVILLPHRKRVALPGGPDVYCYHSRQIDSALAVIGKALTVLNLNDCEMSEKDLNYLRSDLPIIDVALNQFSIAGFDGIEANIAGSARGVLENYVRDAEFLKPTAVIPFASYVYFSCPDNAFMNKHVNTPAMAIAAVGATGTSSVVMKPGDVWTIGTPWNNADAIGVYQAAFDSLATKEMAAAPVVPLVDIEAAFHKLASFVKVHYTGLYLRTLKPVTVSIGDLDTTIVFDLRRCTFQIVGRGTPVDLEINSQPLHFAFSNPFGVQTLGVSGRFRMRANARNWMRHRVLFALNNAQIYLKPRYLLQPAVLGYFWSRRKGLVGQIRHRLARMAKGSNAAPATHSAFED